MNSFRKSLTTKLDKLSEKEIKLALINLVIPITFSKIKRVIISEENLIGLAGGKLAACIPNRFSILPLKKLVVALRGYTVRVVLSIRSFSSYLISKHSERSRHKNYITFDQFIGAREEMPNYSWQPLINEMIELDVKLEVSRFEDYQKDIYIFLAYLSGYNLESYLIKKDHDTLRSVASSKAHSIMSKYALHDPSFYNELDKYFSNEGNRYDPLAKEDKALLESNYDSEYKDLSKLNIKLINFEKEKDYPSMRRERKFSEMLKVCNISDVGNKG